MKIFKQLSIIFICLLIVACGNRKPNKLPDRTIDKFKYPFPPDESYDYENID